MQVILECWNKKYNVPCGETKINIKTLVFQKGIDYIIKLITEER